MLKALVNTERKPGLGLGINYMKDFRALKSKHPRAQERISDLRRRDIRPLCVMKKLRDTSNCLLPLKALKENKSEEVIKRKKKKTIKTSTCTGRTPYLPSVSPPGFSFVQDMIIY